MASTKHVTPRYWEFVAEHRKQTGTSVLVQCARHDLSNCASCAGHDTEEDMGVGRPVTPRTLRPGLTVGEVSTGGWDEHSPFARCTNPVCCDPIDTLRRQTGVEPIPVPDEPEPTHDGKCRNSTHTVRDVFGTLICTTCMTEAL